MSIGLASNSLIKGCVSSCEYMGRLLTSFDKLERERERERERGREGGREGGRERERERWKRMKKVLMYLQVFVTIFDDYKSWIGHFVIASISITIIMF